jgi:hypothetical protein
MQSPAEILRVTEHRPWELPRGPWVMMQSWHDLLFAHWPIAADQLRPLVPPALELDNFEGRHWLSITPFYLRLRPRGLPVLFQFPELNCRTYVKYQDTPGIFFFSLDAGDRFAVWGARTFYRLPYFYSRMTIRSEAAGFSYSCRRLSPAASFTATYAPKGDVRHAAPGSLEHWLTERYCLYAHSRRTLFRADIHHKPWSLQDSTCEMAENGIAAADGIHLPEASPLLQFSREIDVLIWPLRAIGPLHA